MSVEFDTLKTLIEGVNAKVDQNQIDLNAKIDRNFVALQTEYQQMIGAIQPGALSTEDQASVSWLTKVLKAIFNK